VPRRAGRITQRYATPLPRATPAGWRSDSDGCLSFASAGPALMNPLNRPPHERNRRSGLAQHERRIHPQHAIPEPAEAFIPSRVSPKLVDVSAPIHFHDQAQRRSAKVSDEASAHQHLPAKHDAKHAPGGKLPPEAGFR
jgi:hypothetical protein